MHRVKRPLEAIVLAAGQGSRFGGGKLLAPWRGGVLLEGALDCAAAAPVRRLHLVVGADAGAVTQAALDWARRTDQTERLNVSPAHDWQDGMSASLKAGVAALPADADGAFVFLGDMPRVPRSILTPLAEALARGAKAAAPTFNGVLGHPALIGATLFPKIAALAGDRGARAILEALGEALARTPADDDGVLFDVDTPAALSEA